MAHLLFCTRLCNVTEKEDHQEITQRPELVIEKENIEILDSSAKKTKKPSNTSHDLNVKETQETPAKFSLALNTVDKQEGAQTIVKHSQIDEKEENTISKAKNAKLPKETLFNSPEAVKSFPVHEAKALQKKEDKQNDNLNYTMTSETRAINKIPKGKYGYVEDYNLLKAEKFLSKRKSDVKYDANVVYGKASQSTTTPNKEQGVNRSDNAGFGKAYQSSIKPNRGDNEMYYNKDYAYRKASKNSLKANKGDDYADYDNDYDNDNMLNSDKINSFQYNANDDIANSSKKRKKAKQAIRDDNSCKNNNQEKKGAKVIAPLKRKGKNHSANNLGGDINDYNKSENLDRPDMNNKPYPQEIKKREISPIEEENDDDLYSSTHPQKGKTQKALSNNFTTEATDPRNQQLTNPNIVPNSTNKNFKLLFGDLPSDNPQSSTNIQSEPNLNYSVLNTSSQDSKAVNNQGKGPDSFSCENCEPIYRMSILNNIPLKVLKCMICGNIINTTSLDYYLLKYKKELLEKKDKDEASSEQRAADEHGITEGWSNWVRDNKSRVKEQYIYDVLDGKIAVKEHKKQQMHNEYQNTPYEDIFKRKNYESLRSAQRSTISAHQLKGTNEDCLTEGNTYNNSDSQRRAKLIDFTKKLEQDARQTQLE